MKALKVRHVAVWRKQKVLMNSFLKKAADMHKQLRFKNLMTFFLNYDYYNISLLHVFTH